MYRLGKKESQLETPKKNTELEIFFEPLFENVILSSDTLILEIQPIALETKTNFEKKTQNFLVIEAYYVSTEITESLFTKKNFLSATLTGEIQLTALKETVFKHQVESYEIAVGILDFLTSNLDKQA